MEVKLDAKEIDVLRILLNQVKIKTRTGELGISHGLNRFISTNISLQKSQLEKLDSMAKKIGILNGLERTEK